MLTTESLASIRHHIFEPFAHFARLTPPFPSGTHQSVVCIDEFAVVLFCLFVCFFFCLRVHMSAITRFLSFSVWLISLRKCLFEQASQLILMLSDFENIKAAPPDPLKRRFRSLASPTRPHELIPPALLTPAALTDLLEHASHILTSGPSPLCSWGRLNHSSPNRYVRAQTMKFANSS